MGWVGFGNISAYVPAIFWPRKGPVLFLLIKIGTPPRIKFYKFLIYGSYIFEVHYPTWKLKCHSFSDSVCSTTFFKDEIFLSRSDFDLTRAPRRVILKKKLIARWITPFHNARLSNNFQKVPKFYLFAERIYNLCCVSAMNT